MNKKNSFGSRLFMGLVFLFLYAPILLLIIFSFNAGNSSAVWKGFSLKWYVELFQDRLIMQSVYTTLLVSVLATLIATVAGTFAAIGFYNMKRRFIFCTVFPFDFLCIQYHNTFCFHINPYRHATWNYQVFFRGLSAHLSPHGIFFLLDQKIASTYRYKKHQCHN